MDEWDDRKFELLEAFESAEESEIVLIHCVRLNEFGHLTIW